MSFSDPNAALLLIYIGVAAIYWEFMRPGTVAPGVIGSILLLLGIHGLSVSSIDMRGVGLLAASFLFFVAESKFSPHGIWTAVAAATIAAGNLLVIQGGRSAPRVHPAVAIGIAAVFAPLSGFLFTLAERARTNKRAVPQADSRYPEGSSQHF